MHSLTLLKEHVITCMFSESHSVLSWSQHVTATYVIPNIMSCDRRILCHTWTCETLLLCSAPDIRVMHSGPSVSCALTPSAGWYMKLSFILLMSVNCWLSLLCLNPNIHCLHSHVSFGSNMKRLNVWSFELSECQRIHLCSVSKDCCLSLSLCSLSLHCTSLTSAILRQWNVSQQSWPFSLMGCAQRTIPQWLQTLAAGAQTAAHCLGVSVITIISLYRQQSLHTKWLLIMRQPHSQGERPLNRHDSLLCVHAT